MLGLLKESRPYNNNKQLENIRGVFSPAAHLYMHCVSKKTSHFVVRSNFHKYWQIFKIPSLIYSVENLQ